MGWGMTCRGFSQSTAGRHVWCLLLVTLFLSAGVMLPAAAADEPPADDDPWAQETMLDHEGLSPSKLSEEPIPLMPMEEVERPRPLIELGDPFLGTGNIEPGIELPGGAVWQPRLMVFGTYRTAVQAFNDGRSTRSEWANRLDIFANLQLSGTERILVGMRPLDRNNRFTGYNFEGEPTGRRGEWNAEITTLFFEGDFGQIFPDLDRDDRHALDWGFAVGRQPFALQDGIFINDDIDAVGIVRNNILPRGGVNLRAMFLYGWGEIHRNDNQRSSGANLFVFSTESDWEKRTVQADFAYVRDTSHLPDSAHWGIGTIERVGHWNLTARYLGSQTMGDNVPAASSGHLFFAEVSTTPPRTHDIFYVNAFLGVDDFASAARGPDRGGPLGRTGILFAAVGLGRYGAPLGNRAERSIGAAVGYQLFLDDTRSQLIFEVGGRRATDSRDEQAVAFGVRYQRAMGQRWVLQLDAFGAVPKASDLSYGGRVELRYQF